MKPNARPMLALLLLLAGPLLAKTPLAWRAALVIGGYYVLVGLGTWAFGIRRHAGLLVFVAFGLALLIPPLRGFLARRLLRNMLGMSDVEGELREPGQADGTRPRPQGFPPDGPVIEAAAQSASYSTCGSISVSASSTGWSQTTASAGAS